MSVRCFVPWWGDVKMWIMFPTPTAVDARRKVGLRGHPDFNSYVKFLRVFIDNGQKNRQTDRQTDRERN